MEFKSLTMRIWITYTAIILSIILGINLFYTVAYKEISENTKKKDLLAIHNIILNNNLKQPTGYEDFQILFDISHLIIRDGQIKKSSKSNFFREMAAEQNQQLGNKKSNNTNLLPRIRQPSILKDKKLENWISSFAKGKMSDKQFKESYEGLSFLFVISSTDNGYLISYTPDLYDNSLLYILLVIGGIFTVVGFFVAKIVANYITTPLKELENFSKRIAAKNFNEPIIVANQDEIGRLAASMNKMQEDLKRADEEEKLFLQSISHDLKTPVMVIMGHADAIIDGVYIESPTNTAQIIKDEAISLSKKINGLLYFNTLGYALDNQTENEEIELSAFLTRIINRFQVTRNDIMWNSELESGTIVASFEKLNVAVGNILENAIRYAKSEIRITLKKTDRMLELDIFNDGRQIDTENLKKIFENMYKDKTGNFGLGLAISKKIINHYGGSIKAQNRETGVSFVIEFERK